MTSYHIHPVVAADRPWINSLLEERWGATFVVSRGNIYHSVKLPGYTALSEDYSRPVGLITYSIVDNQCQVLTLDSLIENQGIGTALLTAVLGTAAAAGCWRVWLITTNDNLHALGFYQRRDFQLVAVHRDTAIHSRQVKASIPSLGANNIPIRDEIELEYLLSE